MRFTQLLKKLPTSLVWLPGLFILAYAFTGFPFWQRDPDFYFETTTLNGSIDPKEQTLLNFDDALPHYQYKQLEDSLTKIEEIKSYNNVFALEGFGSTAVGFYTRPQKDSMIYDSVTKRNTVIPKKDTAEYYYIGVGNYYLKHDHEVFRDSGRTYLKYPVWTTIDSAKKSKSGHYETKPLKIEIEQYSINKKHESKDPYTLYIPIAKKKFTTIKIIVGGLNMLITFLFFVICILLPIWVIKDIASKRCFEQRTYKRLFLIAITIFGNLLLHFVTHYILAFIYSDLIPEEFSLQLSMQLNQQIGWLITGYVTFILALAFRRGYRLQHDQSLTI